MNLEMQCDFSQNKLNHRSKLMDSDNLTKVTAADANAEDNTCKEILVVDDNPDNLKLIHLLLLENGFKVRLANNGGMALKSIRSKQPDLILLDITMPVLNGFEVCQQLKQHKSTTDIPVIFLSALKEQVDIIQGFSVGGVDFISKPFKSEILLARISTHLKISKLQKDLQALNKGLESRIAERAKKIIETNNKLRLSEARLEYALTASNEGIWDWDLPNNKIYYNDTYFNMLGYDVNELPHNPDTWISLLHPDDIHHINKDYFFGQNKNSQHLETEYRLRKRDGTYCWISSKSMVIEKDSANRPLRIIGTHTDITSEKNIQENLRQLASYDPLTKLANRTLFIDTVTRSIAQARRTSCRHAILFLDLDRFKHINDSLGHSAGDQLLIKVSNGLSTIFRDDDVIARLGGDEFTILLKDVTGTHQVTETAKRILEILNKPFDILGHQVVISASIGIVLYPDNGTTPEDLLKKADTAMYQAKRSGRNNYWFFSEEMNQDAQKHLELEESLRNAIEHEEIILHYQPQVDAITGNIISMEALCRWQKKEGCLVSPYKFIPIAEETGLIVPIGELVFEQAFHSAKNWVDNNLLNQKIAVNISARQFRQKNMLENIMNTLEKFELPAEYLELEITEEAIMDSTDDSINIMKKIKDSGITLAIDDFGTGYSSLSYLKKFPIDTLKIDMSFVKDMEHSDIDTNIVKTIIDLAHHLNLQVVAEGVETRNQAHTLASMGCDIMQGYLFSKPVTEKDMGKLLREKVFSTILN